MTRLLRRLWPVYLLLLALSHAVQLAGCGGSVRGPGPSAVELPAQRAAGPAARGRVRIAYDERGAGTPLIYLHGSPGSRHDFARLAPLLSAEYHTFALDLAGFGDSSLRVPDYGIAAQARYVLAFMDALGIARAHLVAHSWGSGVAYEVADLAPQRVASITSYAGIGVQEAEGSGDYYFEHLKYAAGYALLVALPEALPHFGLLGSFGARRAFIRSFWDTDQRPLRAMLERLAPPLLLVQGRRDPLVPAWTAEEHHRIVEHSELLLLDASHFLVFTSAGSARLAREILPFLRRHDRPGTPPVRRTVDRSGGPVQERLPVPLSIERGLGPWAQLGALVGGTFVSEDLTCVSAGLLVGAGRLDLFVAVLGCALGIFVTDLGLWLIGRVAGRRVLRWRWVARGVSREGVGRIGLRFDRHLGKAVVASRFLPGTRVPMYVAAGVLSRRPLAFVVWLGVATALWTPLLVLGAALFGPAFARPLEAVVGVGWAAWIGAALLLLASARVLVLAATWRGRARLVATVSRLWKPEFWPVWIFYAPVAAWIAWLALRHRGLAVPTAANPAIPHGGFVGESKHAILGRLPAEWIVPSLLVPAGDTPARLRRIRAHAEAAGWSLPLVLKPDEGERGVGLRLLREWDAVERYLEAYPGPVLAQTYDPGPLEAGIFYVRRPDEARGWIFTITDKRFPRVVGDGSSTLEALILRDPRLRMQARVFRRRHAGRLQEVPPAGEPVSLAVSGNHCQGTMFLDGGHLITPQLEETVDAIARAHGGFFFGRFDVRYASADELRAGRGFRIVELNGVTSEATNVYDPAWTLLRAYRTLWRQWTLVFEIGAANRRRGHRVSSLGELWRAAREHYGKLPAGWIAD